ncbi:zinc-binding alcohol dehydrogenase (plasmid) [Arthrobacter sp. StoSoilB3]|nr:zinc-binding alcohol dehydrogenase [Arthrobacter sp. StoSoilB3]
MRAVAVSQFGGPEELRIYELPEPHPGPGEIRIRVRASAVSPTDISFRKGLRDASAAAPPYVPGMDAAGEIDEIGSCVEGWRIGDQVMAIALPLSAHGGAYVEYLVAPVTSIAPVPRGLSLEEAATLPMNGLTATRILELLQMQAGQVLLVTGAAGVVGGYLIQLAKEAGLLVIAYAGERDGDFVEALGADVFIPRGPDVSRRILESHPDGVHGVADTALLHEEILPVLRSGGTFVSVRGWKGAPNSGIRYETVSVADEYHSQSKLERLSKLAEAGKLGPRLAQTLPAAWASVAHRRVEVGGVRGRFVLLW